MFTGFKHSDHQVHPSKLPYFKEPISFSIPTTSPLNFRHLPLPPPPTSVIPHINLSFPQLQQKTFKSYKSAPLQNKNPEIPHSVSYIHHSPLSKISYFFSISTPPSILVDENIPWFKSSILADVADREGFWNSRKGMRVEKDG